MMDYVVLIQQIRYNYTSANKPQLACIVAGGSYGGMLAAWLRMKYPASF